MNTEPLVEIVEAHHAGAHRVRLRFNDGRSGELDLYPFIHEFGAIAYQELRDPEVFGRFTLAHGTLHWPGELDLAPEYLYFQTFRTEPELQDRFRLWGYAS